MRVPAIPTSVDSQETSLSPIPKSLLNPADTSVNDLTPEYTDDAGVTRQCTPEYKVEY